jgi:hypothetical protein
MVFLGGSDCSQETLQAAVQTTHFLLKRKGLQHERGRILNGGVQVG